jgi:hypothetical protein
MAGIAIPAEDSRKKGQLRANARDGVSGSEDQPDVRLLRADPPAEGSAELS